MNSLVKAIKRILSQNQSVVFAYLYGTSKDSEVYNDIDIAVFSTPDSDPFSMKYRECEGLIAEI